ncbi:MAG: carboxylate--amine ligase [Actinobacteria bacterium]|nr:carboxylate--amine ligase [Actinomycetota bacterium]
MGVPPSRHSSIRARRDTDVLDFDWDVGSTEAIKLQVLFSEAKARARALLMGRATTRDGYLFAHRIKRRLLRMLSDESFARLSHWENAGRRLNLQNPQTFNEKLWWLKLHNRQPLLTTCSDKLAVRDYVAHTVGPEFLIPLIGVYNSVEEIDYSHFHGTVFLKTTHGSGSNAIWSEGGTFDRPEFERRFRKALSQNYYHESREWNYRDIEPKIIAEVALQPSDENPLADFRFLCFYGVCKLLFVDIGTAAPDGSHALGAQRNVYDREFNLLDVAVTRERFDPSLVRRPARLAEMVEIAEKLGKPFPFCRVDLYYVGDSIYFGEMTFYPGGANHTSDPESFEYTMGSWIDLDRFLREDFTPPL